MTARPAPATAPPAAVPAATSTRRTLIGLLGAGAVLGVAWSSSLRAFMAQLAGPDSTLTWLGTFLGVILPGGVVGALIGWAEHLRRNGGRRGWRWLAFTTGQRDAAEHAEQGDADRSAALSASHQGGDGAGQGQCRDREPLRLRIPCGVIAFALVPAAYLGPPMRPELDPATPLGAWVATHFSALFITLAIACAIPLRPARPLGAPTDQQ